jgi:hypothetical protein
MGLHGLTWLAGRQNEKVGLVGPVDRVVYLTIRR